MGSYVKNRSVHEDIIRSGGLGRCGYEVDARSSRLRNGYGVERYVLAILAGDRAGNTLVQTYIRIPRCRHSKIIVLEGQSLESYILKALRNQHLRRRSGHLRDDHRVRVWILPAIRNITQHPRRLRSIQKPLPRLGKCIFDVFDQIAVTGNETGSSIGHVIREANRAGKINNLIRCIDATDQHLRHSHLLKAIESNIADQGWVSSRRVAWISAGRAQVGPTGADRISGGVIEAVKTLIGACGLPR